MSRESVQKTFQIAVGLCLVCSIIVSTAAVGLRSRQQAEREKFRQKNILMAAGLWGDEQETDGTSVSAVYLDRVTPVVVDLETNRPDPRTPADSKDLDVERALRDSKLSDVVEGSDDIAGIRRREKKTVVYEIRSDDASGELEKLVLPIRGYGLWSTLWGFIALDVSSGLDDPETLSIVGLTYYKHGETPGLGGEVENPAWKAKWNGKKVYGPGWEVQIEVAKNASGEYQVDALSGATLTSNGVTNMLAYWLGENGYRPYLQRLEGAAADESPEAVEADAE